MNPIEKLEVTSWEEAMSGLLQERAIRNLERGKILFLPQLSFSLFPTELRFLAPDFVDPKRKNISFDIKKGTLGGSLWKGIEGELLKDLLKRYALGCQNFIQRLLPAYAPSLVTSKTSLRPTEISGRKTSTRKDDTRLHVDAFPSNPTQGCRLLRMFTNINTDGKARIWKVGEPFKNVVKKFALSVPEPLPGSAALLRLLKITKAKRTAYDHYMLHMHNQMKENELYQQSVSQQEIHFPPGSSWIVFTDQVSHAALSGKDVLEQTFFLPAETQHENYHAPINILEKFLKKPLNPRCTKNLS